MIRKTWVFTGILLMVGLSGCRTETKEGRMPGIEPYELSEETVKVLEAFGMQDNSSLLRFRMPEKTEEVLVRIWNLSEDRKWEVAGEGNLGAAAEQDTGSGAGTLAISVEENGKIEVHLSSQGMLEFHTDALDEIDKMTVWSRGFLDKFCSAEQNKEIPVAIMVYDDGAEMKSYEPEDYFDTLAFDGMDAVQAVTVEFRK